MADADNGPRHEIFSGIWIEDHIVRPSRGNRAWRGGRFPTLGHRVLSIADKVRLNISESETLWLNSFGMPNGKTILHERFTREVKVDALSDTGLSVGNVPVIVSVDPTGKINGWMERAQYGCTLIAMRGVVMQPELEDEGLLVGFRESPDDEGVYVFQKTLGFVPVAGSMIELWFNREVPALVHAQQVN